MVAGMVDLVRNHLRAEDEWLVLEGVDEPGSKNGYDCRNEI